MIVEELAPITGERRQHVCASESGLSEVDWPKNRANRLDSLRGGSRRKSPPRQLQPTYRPLTRDTTPHT
jgi:hypothetical protein